jgi:hypothetical protein
MVAAASPPFPQCNGTSNNRHEILPAPFFESIDRCVPATANPTHPLVGMTWPSLFIRSMFNPSPPSHPTLDSILHCRGKQVQPETDGDGFAAFVTYRQNNGPGNLIPT